MSAEKLLIGAIASIGIVAAMVLDPKATTRASAPEANVVESPNPPVASRDIETVEDLQRVTSASDCSTVPVPQWNAEAVRALATCLTAAAPIQYPDGNVLTAVRSDGTMLVFAMRHPGSLVGLVADPAAAAEALCNDEMSRRILAEGVSLRMEVVGADGSTIPPLIVDSCA